MELELRAERLDPDYLPNNPLMIERSLDYFLKPANLRLVVLTTVAVIVAAIYLKGVNKSPSTDSSSPDQEVATSSQADTSAQGSGRTANGGGATFTPRMPGRGINVIAGNGQLCLNAIRVAIPTDGHGIRYVPGTDPEAIQYIAATKAAQEHLTVDNGPGNVDMSALPPQNSFTSKAKQVGLTTSGN